MLNPSHALDVIDQTFVCVCVCVCVKIFFATMKKGIQINAKAQQKSNGYNNNDNILFELLALYKIKFLGMAFGL